MWACCSVCVYVYLRAHVHETLSLLLLTLSGAQEYGKMFGGRQQSSKADSQGRSFAIDAALSGTREVPSPPLCPSPLCPPHVPPCCLLPAVAPLLPLLVVHHFEINVLTRTDLF